ncbi:MAG: hypothetical protein R3346_01930 [Candidatus Spechtbacterales bacterium]|nr:hypothetical protein [Candidatus Spechtbacterales bacterium]
MGIRVFQFLPDGTKEEITGGLTSEEKKKMLEDLFSKEDVDDNTPLIFVGDKAKPHLSSIE